MSSVFKKDYIVPIAYGYPSPELLNEANEGKVSLGGCVIRPDNPDFSCNDCGNQWSSAYYDRESFLK